jgi:hypothetical protein
MSSRSSRRRIPGIRFSRTSGQTVGGGRRKTTLSGAAVKILVLALVAASFVVIAPSQPAMGASGCDEGFDSPGRDGYVYDTPTPTFSGYTKNCYRPSIVVAIYNEGTTPFHRSEHAVPMEPVLGGCGWGWPVSALPCVQGKWSFTLPNQGSLQDGNYRIVVEGSDLAYPEYSQSFVIDAANSLSVSKAGSGTGTITSNPAGVNCGTDCTESYGARTTVTLTAEAASRSRFAGWSGACTGTGTCTVTMDSDRSVTATFKRA